METIDIKELLNYYKMKIMLLFVFIVIFSFIGIIYDVFIQKPLYKSTTSIVLVSDSNDDGNANYNDVLANQNLVSTYSEIIKSRKILQEVIDNLNLDYSYSYLSKNIDVSSTTGAQIIEISVTDKNAKRSMNIANEIGKVFSNRVSDLYNISNVNILDEAEFPNKAYNIDILMQSILFFVIGLAVGTIVIFIMYYLDRTVKNSSQIEEKLKLPVLGTLREYRG